MSCNIRKHILALTVLAVFTGIFFRGALSRTRVFVTTGLIQSDLMGFSYPVRDFYARSLKEGKLSFWDKDISSGMPLFAEGQVGALYPANLFFFRFFPMPLAFNLCLVFHFFLATFFTYLLLKVGFGRSFWASILSGLCFGFSGFLTAHLVHFSMIEVAAFFPLVLLLIVRQVEKFSWRHFFGLTLVFFLQILAGHVEVLYFSLVALSFFSFLLAILFYQEKGFSAFTPLFLLGGALVLALLFSAFQVLPSLELTGFSSRGAGITLEDADNYLFPFGHLIYFVFPRRADFFAPVVFKSGVGTISNWETYGYLGILPLVFATLAVVCSLCSRFSFWKTIPQSSSSGEPAKEKRQAPNFPESDSRLRQETDSSSLNPSSFPSSSVWVGVFFGLGLFSLLFSMGTATPVFEVLWRTVPFMRFFQYPTRLLVFAELSLAVLAGFGLDLLIKRAWWRTGKRGRLLVLQSLPLRTIPVGSLFRGLVLFLIITFSFLDLNMHNSSINPTVDSSWWFEETEAVKFLKEKLDSDYRFRTFGASSLDYRLTEEIAIQKELQNLLPANFNLIYELSSTEGLCGLSVGRFAKLSEMITRASVWKGDEARLFTSDDFVKLSALRGEKFILSDLEIQHPKLQLVEKWPFSRPLARNIYVFKGQKVFIGEQVSVSGVHVYENLDALSRAQFVPEAVWARSETEALAKLGSKDFDPAKTVVLEGGERTQMEQIKTDNTDDLLNPLESVESVFLGGKSSVEIITDEDQKVVIKVSAPSDGYLVFSDTYYPGWHAYIAESGSKEKIGGNQPGISVDQCSTDSRRLIADLRGLVKPAGASGDEVEILRANYNFRATPLSKGEHLVTFTYEPESFKRGLMISIISLAMLASLFVYWRLKTNANIRE